MILHAFAKINWSLDITGVREDGYHLMDMLMQPVSLYDEIELRPAQELAITTGGYPRSRADETNLAWKAAALLKEAAGYPGGASVHVHKSIPVGAGLGGGSADAAAVLYGLNQLWKTCLSSADLETLGLRIGADVPFALRGGLCRTRGIGEDLENHRSRCHYWMIVWQPCPGLSTAQIFSSWKQSEAPLRPETDQALRALENGDFSVLCSSVRNVLQPVACAIRPEIRDACALLEQHGAEAARMTGSGSAVFGVFRGKANAVKAFDALRKGSRSVFLCHTQDDSLRVMEE